MNSLKYIIASLLCTIFVYAQNKPAVSAPTKPAVAPVKPVATTAVPAKIITPAKPSFDPVPTTVAERKEKGDALENKINEELKKNNFTDIPDVNTDCGSEIKQYCKEQPAGSPLLMRCLNEASKITPSIMSNKCQITFKISQLALARSRVKFAACAPDFNKLCVGVPTTPPTNIRKCLLSKFKDVSLECKAVMREAHPSFIGKNFEVLKLE